LAFQLYASVLCVCVRVCVRTVQVTPYSSTLPDVGNVNANGKRHKSLIAHCIIKKELIISKPWI
jgi:hypothetical protein